MATTAFDEPYGSDQAKPPLSLHPAFPAIVALWFAALLGLGSLVLPVVLLERAVEGSGIASLIPAANPPLGFTARGIVALLGALAGAGLGIGIARRVAAVHQPRPASRAAKLATGTRVPISIKDEVGGEGVVNGESLPINRRRALAISEDDRPSDFLYHAPLPGDEAAPLTAPAEEASTDDPLELSELAEEARSPFDETEPANHEDDTMIDPREFHPASSAQPFDAPQQELSATDPFAMQDGEPLPFSAPSLARRGAEPEPELAPELPAEPEAHLAAVATDAESEDPEPRADWKSAPLDGLGLVQLVQRLGSTIERRRELMAQAAPVAASAPYAADAIDFEAAPAEEAAQAMAAYFGSAAAPQTPPAEAAPPTELAPSHDFSAAARPGFLQPFGDEDEEEDSVPDFSLPLRRGFQSAAPFAADDDADDEDDGYSSLVGMSNPFAAPRADFVRIEEPEPEPESFEPAVVFPGQGESEGRLFDPPGAANTAPARIPADTDEALRAALATLQRMSGAA